MLETTHAKLSNIKYVPRVSPKYSGDPSKLEEDRGKFRRRLIRDVKLFAKQSIVHIKANDDKDYAKRRAINTLKDILKFQGLDPKWGVHIAQACLESMEVVELLKLSGAAKEVKPSYIRKFFDGLKEYYDKDPSEKIKKVGKKIFSLVHTKKGFSEEFKAFIDMCLDISDRFMQDRPNLDRSFDPLFLKTRMALVNKVLYDADEGSVDFTASRTRVLTVTLNPDDPEFKEASFLKREMVITLNDNAFSVLRKQTWIVL